MKQFVVFLLCLFVCVIPMQAKVYLVSIGIADYPKNEDDLRVSDNDAKAIAKVFFATKDAVVNVLVNQEATQAALLSTMHTTFSDALADDAVILYFSGHGAPGNILCYDGLLSYQYIFKMLKGCKANRKMIIVDACYAGKMRTGEELSADYGAQSVLLFLSSRTNELSKETSYKNSLFTIFLERGLRGGADVDRNRVITARELYDFVHQGVIKASNNHQHPVMWGKFDDDMTIIEW